MTDADRWRAVLARDAGADDSFVFAVKTTGIFCRPSCAARRPLRKNVRFYATPAEAQLSGYRACRRCRPLEASAAERRHQLVITLCRQLERAERTPTLAELARGAGISPFHLQRVFKQVLGVSPRQYALAQKDARFRQALARQGTITAALHEAGFSSSSRLYERSMATLGGRPADVRRGAPEDPVHFALTDSSLGRVLVAATRQGVCAVAFGDDDAALVKALKRRFPRATRDVRASTFTRLVHRVVEQVEAPAAAPGLPLDLRGTAFQHRVWQALTRIPPGETRSYSALAQALGAPRSARAVAQACGANPVAVLVPCHRVVREGGALSGYRWGVERKAALLRREATLPRRGR
ncbi:MAG: bifunctional DNA-binding transcriptional regulator/O6-methylguanine-DNA methyltransferase Ada [Myxococcaceae bacterium]|nr:bifunctional DNA-binding transcriptional regulator/O6-methylguanine-DNA methyltransferase Ada [Myxococcaceae bacterium]